MSYTIQDLLDFKDLGDTSKLKFTRDAKVHGVVRGTQIKDDQFDAGTSLRDATTASPPGRPPVQQTTQKPLPPMLLKYMQAEADKIKVQFPRSETQLIGQSATDKRLPLAPDEGKRDPGCTKSIDKSSTESVVSSTTSHIRRLDFMILKPGKSEELDKCDTESILTCTSTASTLSMELVLDFNHKMTVGARCSSSMSALCCSTVKDALESDHGSMVAGSDNNAPMSLVEEGSISLTPNIERLIPKTICGSPQNSQQTSPDSSHLAAFPCHLRHEGLKTSSECCELASESSNDSEPEAQDAARIPT